MYNLVELVFKEISIWELKVARKALATLTTVRHHGRLAREYALN